MFRDFKDKVNRKIQCQDDEIRNFRHEIADFKTEVRKHFTRLECKHCACKPTPMALGYSCCKCGNGGLPNTCQEIEKEKTDRQAIWNRIQEIQLEIINLKSKAQSSGGGTRKKGKGKR
jgi:hypothetical protein